MIKAFAERMLAHGYFPGLYSQKSFFYPNGEETTTLYDLEEISDICDIWLAHYFVTYPDGTEDYTEHINNNIDKYKDKFGIWQYQGDIYGYIGAMEGACDLNLGFRDYAKLIKQFGFNGFTIPEVEEEPEAPSPEPTPDPNP